jgi:hypothetical protein
VHRLICGQSRYLRIWSRAYAPGRASGAAICLVSSGSPNCPPGPWTVGPGIPSALNRPIQRHTVAGRQRCDLRWGTQLLFTAESAARLMAGGSDFWPVGQTSAWRPGMPSPALRSTYHGLADLC